MSTFYLLLSSGQDPCYNNEYSIGCGQCTVQLEAETYPEAVTEAEAYLAGKTQEGQDPKAHDVWYTWAKEFDEHINSVVCAKIVELRKDMLPFVQDQTDRAVAALKAKEEQQEQDKKLKEDTEKRALFEKLKKELGVE